MVLEEVLNSLYDDVLPTIPMKLSVGVLAYLATMGAVDLYYFMLGYLVDVGISTIERVYLSQIQ
jgi:histidine ammonia-lyase